MKKALITGITGQDGSYLAEFLLEKKYEVHGMVRRVAIEDPTHRLWRINHILDKIIIHPGSLDSYASVFNIVEKVKPDECYHLAAQSFVSYSFEDEFSTIITNINGTHFVLSAIKEKASHCKVYFAASSEMFGLVKESPQNEETPFHPRSPYGISKVAGFHLARNYREAYNIFTSSGILFNHESPRRGFEFVTRKITSAVSRIKNGLENKLVLGNLYARRDWGYAGDYVQAMWLMLQQDIPDDYVIATGETHTIKEFVEKAFTAGGFEIKWEGEKYEEKGIDKKSGEILVEINSDYYRPSEVQLLLGDTTKAKSVISWQPTVKFEKLVEMMVSVDIDKLAKD